jgi:hypothetical protein
LVDSAGNPAWLKKIGGKATITNVLNCTNNTGNAFIAGAFRDSLELAGELKATEGESGIFLARLLADGSEADPVVMKSTALCKLGGISSNDSLVCVAGSFSDTLRVNDTTLLVSMGEEDVFVAMFNHSGQLRWLIDAGGMGNEQTGALVMNGLGETAITGTFDYSFLLGDQIVQTNGEKDIFIAVIHPDGNLKWMKSIGGIANDYGYAIAENSQDDLFVSGSFTHVLQLPDENGNIVEMEAYSAFGNTFIAKYNSAGTLKASFNLPGTSEDYCKQLIARDDGIITAAGNFYETMQIEQMGGQTYELVSTGEKDMFLMQFKDMCTDFTVDAGADTAICPGQALYLPVSGSYIWYKWSPGGSANAGLEVTQPGVYTLNVTGNFGCLASDSLVVSQASLPIVFAGSDTTIQAGEIMQLDLATAENVETVHWTTSGSGYFSNPDLLNAYYSLSFDDISAGSVVLTLTGTNACGATQGSFTLSLPQEDDGITVFPNPTPDAIALVCEEGMNILTATITNQSGNVIQAGIPVNNTYFQYDLSPYPPGTFLFHITTNVSNVTKVINKL